MADSNLYIYVLRPARPELPFDPTPEEQEITSIHFDYLRRKFESGELIMAGRTLDENTFGIVIIRAESDEAARAFMENDPGVIHGIQKAEIHPFRIALGQ